MVCARAADPAPVPLARIPHDTLVRIRCSPDVGPFPVLSHMVAIHRGGGEVLSYELGLLTLMNGSYVERSFVVRAANVFIKPGDNPEPASAPAPKTGPKPTATKAADEPESATPSLFGPPPVFWEADGKSGRRSTDGRFQVREEGGFFSAVDNWTCESVGPFAFDEAAYSWCRSRRDGQALYWRETAAGFNAEHRGDLWFVTKTTDGKYLASDPRLPTRNPRKISPWFADPQTAQHWCQIRAACEIDGAASDEQVLRYDSPITF
jgi:hypothetical protein